MDQFMEQAQKILKPALSFGHLVDTPQFSTANWNFKSS